MHDPLALFHTARGHEPFWHKELLETPKAARREFDDFAIEAAIMIAERGYDLVARVPHLAVEARRVGLGLARWRTLWPLWTSVVSQDVEAWPDAALWLWGPPARSGGKLFGAVSILGRGRIVRALVDAGWTNDMLVPLIGEWLDAGKVHRTSRDYAVLVFKNPRAPVVQGRSAISPPTPAMRFLAARLAPDDDRLADAVAILCAWLVARSGGTSRVSVPSTAVTQGRDGHVDAPGISARQGRKAWTLVRDTVLHRTRGHSAGRSAAEYEFAPEFSSIFTSTT